MAFSSDFLYDLHRANDIAEFIGRDQQLKKRGKTYVGLCPFHNEKTPSFVVYPDTQSFYCFGCGTGGDIITYVKLRDNLSYAEAVRLLAQNAGMAMPNDEDDKASKQKVKILAANKFAARFFHSALNSDSGKAARKYLRDRCLSDATIVRFGIGFAPDSWQSLSDALTAEGFYPDELIAAGLCGKNKHGGLYDRFRNRLMFPIIDLRGNVVGFGGRRLNEQDSPKYINTNDTPVYKKSRVLYALNYAKSTTTRSLILTEGYMDTISLHQSGFGNAVASCGTSITEEHARLISQYADEVVIAYDGDEAGRTATKRAMEVLKPTGLLVRVLDFEGAKDPDEYIKKNGAPEFERLLKESDTSTEYELNRAKRGLDMDSQAGRVEYLKLAAGILARCQNPTEIEVYAGRVATETAVNKSAILTQVEYIKKQFGARKAKEEQNKLLNNISTEYRQLRDKGGGGQVGSEFAKWQLLAMLCHNPDFCRSVAEALTPSDFDNAELGNVFSRICELTAEGSFDGFPSVSGDLSQESYSMLARYFAKLDGKNNTVDDALFLASKIKQTVPSPEELSKLSDEEIQKIIEQNK